MFKQLDRPHVTQKWHELTVLLLCFALSGRPGTLVLNTPAACFRTHLAFTT